MGSPSHGSARGRRTWSSQTPCLVSSRCSHRGAGRPCVYGSRKSTRIVAGAARRRFAAASPRRSLVERHPRRFRAASRSTSRAHRYPGAAPRSRPGAPASGPLQLSASVCVNMPNLSYILPLHYTKPKLIDPPYRPVTLLKASVQRVARAHRSAIELEPGLVPRAAKRCVGSFVLLALA